MKRIIGCIAAALLMGGAWIGSAQIPTTVLDIDPGVASLGVGATGLSIANGAETLYYNPAGLSQLPGISFSSFYASYLGLADYSAFALSLKNFGVAALLLNAGNIQGYDDEGTPTETLSYGSTAFILGAGLRPSELPFLPDLPFDFSLGLRLKTVSTRWGEASGRGFSFDLGFWAPFPSMRLGGVSISEIGVGLVANNLFGSISYETVRETFGMGLQVGLSALFLDVVRTALDVNLGDGSIHFGVAYAPVSTLHLRVGVIARNGVSLTGGVGLSIEGFLIDYGFKTHTLGATHRVSLTLDFSALDAAALSRSFRRILP